MDGFFIDPDVVRETGSRMPGPAMGTVMEDCKAESDGLVTAKVEYELGEKGKKPGRLWSLWSIRQTRAGSGFYRRWGPGSLWNS